MNTKKRNKGFTLIELLITVSVIGILGTVAVTAYVGSTLKASRSEAYQNLSSLRMYQEQFFAENGTYNTIPGNFPGFTPWQAGIITEYTYVIVGTGIALPAGVPPVPYAGAAVPQAPCFIATATGNPNTRVFGDIFVIDCNNNKNF